MTSESVDVCAEIDKMTAKVESQKVPKLASNADKHELQQLLQKTFDTNHDVLEDLKEANAATANLCKQLQQETDFLNEQLEDKGIDVKRSEKLLEEIKKVVELMKF
ncbi:unnamed protein product [Caenorhabditis sp. 36 PRJEB53466]|nr:unnamed protein product [Caenorhabditis sp. 36 PRJEB53466]